MTAIKRDDFRRRLQKLIHRLGGETEQLRHEVLGDGREPNTNTAREQYTEDDLSREEADEEVALAVLGNEEQLLAQCQAALDRIDRGVFGKCEVCGRGIGQKRLNAMPYVARCHRCAQSQGD